MATITQIMILTAIDEIEYNSIKALFDSVGATVNNPTSVTSRTDDDDAKSVTITCNLESRNF